MACENHNDPAKWRDEDKLDSRGYIRTVCRDCGAFIGYRPKNKKDSAGPELVAAAAEQAADFNADLPDDET